MMQNNQKLFSWKFFVPLCIVFTWLTAMFVLTQYHPFAGIIGQAAANEAVLLYPSQPQDAYSLALFALGLDSNIYEANVVAGYVLYDQNDFSGGIPYFQKSALIKSNNCGVQFGLGYGYEATGEATKAINQYQIVEQKCPQDIDVLNSLIEAYVRLGYEEGAIRIRQKLSQLTLSSPIPTAIATPSLPTDIKPTPTQKVSTIYDNFDDATYNGSWNNLLWARGQGSSGSTSAIQQNGALEFSDTNNTVGEGLILNLVNWQEPKFRFFEAKIKVHYVSGSNGNISLDAFSSALPSGWSEINISPTSSGAVICVLVNNKGVVTKKVNNDRWYVLRIEYDESKNELNYYLDGEQIASYAITQKVSKITPGIQLWHPRGDSVTGYIDYVSIGD